MFSTVGHPRDLLSGAAAGIALAGARAWIGSNPLGPPGTTRKGGLRHDGLRPRRYGSGRFPRSDLVQLPGVGDRAPAPARRGRRRPPDRRCSPAARPRPPRWHDRQIRARCSDPWGHLRAQPHPGDGRPYRAGFRRSPPPDPLPGRDRRRHRGRGRLDPPAPAGRLGRGTGQSRGMGAEPRADRPRSRCRRRRRPGSGPPDRLRRQGPAHDQDGR